MSRQQKIMSVLWVMAFAVMAAGIAGYKIGRGSVRMPAPTVEVRIDTVTVTEVRVDTVERVRTVTAWLPVAAPEDRDEPMDTIDYGLPLADSARVEVPISRYVAQQDSLYRVVAEGYAVQFREITVYPKTVTVTRTVEVRKDTRWGLGIQAGYGAAVAGGAVRLSPYVGLGLSYNIVSW